MYFKSDICFTHFCGEFEKLKSSYSFLKENILFWLRSTHYPNSKGTEKPNKCMLNHILTIIQMFLCITHDLFWTKGKFLKKKADYRTGHHTLDTVQDFLIMLGIKLLLHLLKISIFSLNHVILRPTKIMNNLLKDCKICTFKVISQHQKSTESFWFFLWRILD